MEHTFVQQIMLGEYLNYSCCLFKGDDQETSLVQLRNVEKQLEQAESEVSSLKSEKEQWNKKIDDLQRSLQQQASELEEKRHALLELEKKTSQKLNEVEENYKEKCCKIEEKCEQLEKKWSALQKEKEDLLGQIADRNQEVIKLSTELSNLDYEGKKNKQVIEELNHTIQQLSQKKEELLVSYLLAASSDPLNYYSFKSVIKNQKDFNRNIIDDTTNTF